ncbi:MAG TPA: poly(3-hydroxyalkanoate) depolymerase [Burkholderiaceae bacterium]|nr:poly(3-hydroxyalkanoate) depolymerase [Burkholderiaceae bacterium]
MTRTLQTFTVELEGQTLRAAIGGAPGASRVLLFFNGIGASVETVASFAAKFRRTRIVTFDVPGVGGSPTPPVPYRLKHLVGLAAGLLDHLGIGSVDVFGVSWGGAAAQEFAIRFPDRARTLTLAATTAGWVMVPGSPMVLRNMLSPRRYFDAAHLMAIGGELYGGMIRTERELLRVHAEALRSPTSLGYLYQMLAIWGWTSWHRLPRVEAPALILTGTDDPIVPPVNGRILASRLPNAVVEDVDCGHLFILTRADEIADRVERFVHGAHADRAAPRTRRSAARAPAARRAVKRRPRGR